MFVTYSIILSYTIEITPICVLMHRDLYLSVMRNNFIRDIRMKWNNKMHNTMVKQNAEPGN